MDQGPHPQHRKNLQKALRDMVTAPLSPTMLALLARLNEAERERAIKAPHSDSPKSSLETSLRSRQQSIAKEAPRPPSRK